MIRRSYIMSLSLLLIGMISISGCVGRGAAVPDDHFYQLPEILPEKTFDDHLVNNTIAVEPFRSDGLHGERAILYVNSQRPLELQRYHYYHWTASPPHLIQESLLKYLRKSRVAQNIVRHDPVKHVDGIISGTLLHFERITGPGGIKVDVALELEYDDQKLHQTWHKEYHVTLPVRNSSLHATIEGFGSALQQIFDTFVEELKSGPA